MFYKDCFEDLEYLENSILYMGFELVPDGTRRRHLIIMTSAAVKKELSITKMPRSSRT